MSERVRHRRSPSRIRRRHPKLEGKPRILILSEGAKTETNYFKGLKTANRLTSVVIRPLHGQPGPLGLWRRATEELQQDPDWDEVYCVLDHDGRNPAVRRLEAKLQALDREYPDSHVRMILSDPCFEFWLLLHFQLTDRPFLSAGGGRTACESVIAALRSHIPEYQKNATGVFRHFNAHVEVAVANAERLMALGSNRTENSPNTDVGNLVNRLLEIAGL